MADLPAITDDDRRRATLLVEGAGGGFAPETVDFFAQGIAIARTGGDVRAWLRQQTENPR